MRGFSAANPQQLYLPIILDPEYHYESVNVEMQRRNTSSLFWFMKRMINMRKNFKAFGRGDLNFIPVDNPKILAFTRSYRDETLLIIVNLSKYAQPAELDLKQFKGYQPVELFGKNRFPVIKENSPYFFTLSPHAFQWYQLEKIQTEVRKMQAVPHIELTAWSSHGTRRHYRSFNPFYPLTCKAGNGFQEKTGLFIQYHLYTLQRCRKKPGTAFCSWWK